MEECVNSTDEPVLEDESTSYTCETNNNEYLLVINPNDELSKVIEFRNLVSSWGLSPKTINFLADTHECTIKTLELIDLDGIDDIFENYPKGEKIIFKACLRKWRNETNNPLQASDATRSLNSRVVKWIEEQPSNSSPVSGASAHYDACSHELEPGASDISHILNNNIKGRMVINYFEQHKSLDDKHRKYMVHTIIDHYMSKKYKLTGNDFENLSKKIVNMFPSEYSTEYYIGRRGKKKPSGKLYDRYSNQCFGTKYLKVQTNSATERITSTYVPDSLPSDDFLNNKHWLKYNLEPWDLVCNKWKETSNDRMLSFKSSANKNIVDFLIDWPLYKHHLGYQLIEIDFDTEYPSKGKKLLDRFDSFVNVCRTKVFITEVKDKNNQQLLRQLNESENFNENIRDIIVCLLIHAIIQPKRVNQKIKPTISDAQEDFVVFISNLNELNGKLDELKRKFGSLQPKIVVVGNKWEHIDETFVIYEDIKYKCGSFRKCLDTIFKLSFVFNTEYSKVSKEVWYFLQEYFFDIESNQTGIKKYIQLFN